LAAAAVFIGLNLFFLGFAEGTGGLARIQFAPACMAFNLVAAGAVAAVTMLAGRIYCSVVCPLGVFQDIVLWLRKLFAKANFSYRPGRIVVRAASATSRHVPLTFRNLIFISLPPLLDRVEHVDRVEFPHLPIAGGTRRAASQ
jgi:hypothetical protein